jgi:UDP-N-acetylglucosamine 1-carboxyvinyltransferase
MDRIRIRGGNPLTGVIPIGGAKNAALPLMAASLLTDDTLSLANVPHLADIASMAHLLQQHGVKVTLSGADSSGGAQGRVFGLKADEVNNTVAPYDLVRKMRASVLVLGPLVARFGEAEVSLPGGCAIGTRPVNLHIDGLAQMGADISIDGGYIRAKAPKGLKGAHIRFPTVSVGASENLLMAATLAQGVTVMENVALEPEVTDLARCLVAMGADIKGIGGQRLEVRGVKRLHGARYGILPDRIETGTYAIAAAATGGDVELAGADFDTVATLAEKLVEAGCVVERTAAGVRVARNGAGLRGVDAMTQPYPGFPTDMQAQLMALMTTAQGAALITETIFENRFMHVPELARMGADITVHGASVLVRGVPRLKGAPVMATDLRASVSLVLAGLMAEGETMISRVYHLDRGYERLEEKLAGCGAEIERVKE